MLVSNLKEVNRFLPSNVIKNFEMISSFIVTCEKEYILSVLGRDLYKALQDQYDKETEMETGWKDLLDAVQYPLVNFAMYKALPKNNVTIMIGGASVVSSQNMEVASQKRVDSLAKSLYEDAQNGIEQLLSFLEEDATTEKPLFKEYWEKSRYYYQTGNLINTATVFQEYVNIMGSRAKFVELKPHIAYCEKVYIRPELSSNLVEYLIKNDGNLNDAHLLIQDQIRNSLAYYVADRDPGLHTDFYKNNAHLLLSDVRNELFSNPDKYPAFKESSLYISFLASRDTEDTCWKNGNDKQIFVIGGSLQN